MFYDVGKHRDHLQPTRLKITETTIIDGWLVLPAGDIVEKRV